MNAPTQEGETKPLTALQQANLARFQGQHGVSNIWLMLAMRQMEMPSQWLKTAYNEAKTQL